MTTANRHMTRSHRSFREKKATLGDFTHKQYTVSPKTFGEIPLLQRLKEAFSFRRQGR